MALDSHPSRGWRRSCLERKSWPRPAVSTMSSACASAAASSSPPGRSTAAPARPGTTARLASSSRRTSSGSGGSRSSPSRDDVVGLDSSVILPRQVWVASGHVGVFTDPLTECLHCHRRFRADHLEEDFEARKGRAPTGLAEIACPNCGTRGQWTEPRDFNMMLKTYLGAIEDESGLHYLRPGDRAGHLRQLRQRGPGHAQEAAVRYRSGRQVVPQRDHAGQLHLPHPGVRADGDGVLRRARHR